MIHDLIVLLFDDTMIIQMITISITGVTLFSLKQQYEAYQSYRVLIRNKIDKDRKIYWLEGKLIGPVSQQDHGRQPLLIEKTDVWKATRFDSSIIRGSEMMDWIRASFNPYLKLDSHLDLVSHPSNPIRILTSDRASIAIQFDQESQICSYQPVIYEIPASIDIQKWTAENLKHQIPLLNSSSNYKVIINKLHHQDPVFAVITNHRQVIAIGSRRQVKSLIANQIYKFSPRKCGLLISLPLITFAMISHRSR